ncbi:hypothetical protein TBLA_0A01690 [Henningerozyma blattae CBS 6284]|uniref:Uncharacterized protein n=1 Tax=Henningerozyma blattae (strain ATCC 34711 / CBS 6284 / DSM 70876 / NBRC 10599 / NRRL Y-10934 / UCD 77-7) TaxID=1071380 RepID=I2GV17_HENB6|nr:hypothetical protein TBLA_0A01690 [Tetrapisispora blattae CBS 6284]CCH57969.1 hypothetical protein TBLA_0A01690 [Tetrapisispora blattae CBS 6284]
MNNIDCSVNNNPLAQLSKHTQQQPNNAFSNRNLSNGYQNNFQGGSAANSSQQDVFQGKRNVISDAHKAHMNSFMNGGANQLPSPPMVNSPQSMDRGSITMDDTLFQQRSPPVLSKAELSQRISQSRNEFDWVNEFKNQSNVSTPNTTQNPSTPFLPKQIQRQPSQLSYLSNSTFQSGYFNTAQIPAYFTGSDAEMLATNSSTNMQQQFNTQFQQQKQPSTNIQRQVPYENDEQELWDKQFKQLENEVSEKLHISGDDVIAPQSHLNNQSQQEQNNSDEMMSDEYQSQFQKVWDSIQEDSQDVLPDDLLAGDMEWETTYRDLINETIINRTPREYEFEKQNEFLNNPDSYTIGCLLMENGAKLSEAAMAFEAAVQENPKHVDAWLKLGLVQTQNEKELIGISALEQCLKLDSKNLEAMKNLAISYINEGYDISAFTMLSRWVKVKYPEYISNNNSINNLEMDFNIDDDNNHKELNRLITKQFLQLANRLPTIDPDIQLCLGLLFYTTADYDKTIDCFKTALTVNPNDELMWNRLGASLANSNRSEEAVAAYHRALTLKPSFVRARYNLAVSSINIGCFKEAAEHLLTALSMHEINGILDTDLETNFSSNTLNNAYKSHTGLSTNSGIILDTLKRAFIAMDRSDLLEKVKPGMNLQQFRNEFTF